MSPTEIFSLIKDGYEVITDLVRRWNELGLTAEQARTRLRALHARGLQVQSDLQDIADGKDG